MAFYILIFGILAVVSVFAFFVLRGRRGRRCAISRAKTPHTTGPGHVRAPIPDHAAKQKHAPAHHEAGASGGTFHKGGLAAKVKEIFKGGDGEQTWKGLEDLLIKADVGPTASADLVQRIKADYAHGKRPGEPARRRDRRRARTRRAAHVPQRSRRGDHGRRRQRHRQDDDDRQAREAPGVRRHAGQPRGRGHVPGGGLRAARGVGAAFRRAPGGPGSWRRSRRGGFRRGEVRDRAWRRRADRGHGGKAPQQDPAHGRVDAR